MYIILHFTFITRNLQVVKASASHLAPPSEPRKMNNRKCEQSAVSEGADPHSHGRRCNAASFMLFSQCFRSCFLTHIFIFPATTWNHFFSESSSCYTCSFQSISHPPNSERCFLVAGNLPSEHCPCAPI